MRLSKKQAIFARNVALLIKYANSKGYEVTFGDCYRPSFLQRILIKMGKSWTMKSQHSKRLAVDLNLFKDGKYLTSSSSHRFLGKEWERLNHYNVWGGRFNDGNHYEMRHDYPRRELRNGHYSDYL